MLRTIKHTIFFAVLFALLATIGAAPSEAAEETHQVKYGTVQNSKFVNAYPKWNVTAKKGQTVMTPKVADRNGKRCYWRISGNNGKTGEIANGKTFILYGSANLSAQWKPLYTIRLFKYNGTKEHLDKRITLAKGEKFHLPRITPHPSKLFLGWAKVKNATSARYNCTTRYTMVRSIDLYEVIVPRPKTVVTLNTYSGAYYKTVIPNGKETFPTMQCSGYGTFQGWSRTKGKSCNPEYMEGQIIPSASATYYPVVANMPKDPVASSTETVSESKRYAAVYFVGDSRMDQAKVYFGQNMTKTKFIAKGGMGYDWFTQKGGAYDQLITMLRKNNNAHSGKNAVIFCFGVNDLQNYQKYIKFYKSKASALKQLNCDLYVMSVNPFCVGQRYYWNNARGNTNYVEKRTQSARITFNKALKQQLNGTYTYVDTFSYLVKTGWPTSDLSNSPTPDGLHYTLDTTKRIVSRASAIMDAYY